MPAAEKRARKKGWERVSSRRGCGGLGGRPSSPRRGKPFRSGVDPNSARTHPHQNLSISTGLSVDRQGITMHPFLGSVFWSGMLPFVFPGCLGGEGFSSAGSRSPSRAPAGGREETRSPPILPAPSPATDKKRIYRLFSALLGNNRSPKRSFPSAASAALEETSPSRSPFCPKTGLVFFPNLSLLSQNVQSGWFSILRQVFP